MWTPADAVLLNLIKAILLYIIGYNFIIDPKLAFEILTQIL